MSFKDLVELSSNRVKFVIENVDLSIVNSVRRIILSEIPTAAFYFDPYDVENNAIKIHKNNGVLHNEFIAHRISLVPLWFDENEIANFDAKKYMFSLKVKNQTPSDRLVTTDDFTIVNENKEPYPDSFVKKILPSNSITKNHILITKLKPNLYDLSNGEELDLECMPSIDIAKTHARWSAVSQACYFNNIDDDLANEAFEQKLEEVKKQKGSVSQTEISDMRSRFDSLEAQRHFKRNKYDEPSEFTFLIESECRLRPSYLFFKALSILASKLSALADKLESNELDQDVQLSQIGKVDNFFQLKVKNEDHTLFNVLQCMIFNQQFRKSASTPLTYIGYYQPHPHDNLMYLKLKFTMDDEAITQEYVRNFLAECIKKVAADVNAINKEWIEFSKLDKTNIDEIASFMGA